MGRMKKTNRKINTLLPVNIKPDYALLPVRAIRYAVTVLTQGRNKPDWRNFSPDYHYSALQRHLTAWRLGEMTEPHLTHALCRMLFLFETALTTHDKQSTGDKQTGAR